MRAHAYLQSGNPDQALKVKQQACEHIVTLVRDAQFIGARGVPKDLPKLFLGSFPTAAVEQAIVMQVQDARVALAYGPTMGEGSAWGHAHSAHSAALEAGQEWLPAALAMQRAVERDPAQPRWATARDRLLLRIPEQPAAILQVPLLIRRLDMNATLLIIRVGRGFAAGPTAADGLVQCLLATGSGLLICAATQAQR